MRVPQVSERIKEAPAHALRGVFAGIGQLLLITDKLRHKTPADSDVPRARTPEASETVTDAPVTNPADQRAETATAPAEPTEPAAAAPAPGAATPAAPAPAAPAPAEAAIPVGETASGGKTVAAGEPVAAEPTAAMRAAAKPATARRTAATAKPAAKAAPAKAAPAKPATAKRTAAKAAAAEPAAEAPPKPPKRQSTRDFDKTGNVRLLGDEADSSPLGAAAPAAPEPVSVEEPAASPVAAAPPLPNYDELSVASLRARLRNLDVAQVRQLAEYERAHAARADVLAMFERRIAKLEAEA